MHLTALSPMLEVTDLQATIDYYTGILGFTLQGTWPDEGPIQWTSLTAGEVTLMFMTRVTPDEIPEDTSEATSEPKPPCLTGQLYCYPPDVDALWNELKEKVDIAWPLDNMTYGMREFAIRDCNGYLLTFGQDLSP